MWLINLQEGTGESLRSNGQSKITGLLLSGNRYISANKRGQLLCAEILKPENGESKFSSLQIPNQSILEKEEETKSNAGKNSIIKTLQNFRLLQLTDSITIASGEDGTLYSMSTDEVFE